MLKKRQVLLLVFISTSEAMFNLLIFTNFISFLVGAPLQYVFVNESVTWSDAQSYCREKFTDLATIEDLQQTVQILDVAGDGLIDLAWIGLYDDLNVWKWTLQDTDLVQGGSDFAHWYDPTPVVDHTDGMCVYTQSGVWYADNCLTQHSFICYDGRPNATATYVQSVPTKSWSDAQSYCREFYTDLASIRSETENMEIELFVSQIFYQMIWIGLYRTRSWSDQSNSTFRNWGSGEPRDVGTCTAVNFLDETWAEESCGDDLSFFCYSGPASSRQYYFVNQQVNWTEAQSFCREFYTDMATIDNPVEMNQLISMIPGLFGGYCCLAWIGLYDDLNSWRWSLQDESFYKEGEKDFRNFYHEPNNDGGNQLCVYMNGDGYWFDENCDTIMEFICYDGRPNSTQTYIRITQNYKNWTDARQYCRELYSDLVNVRNLTEHQQIYNNLRGPPAWIGLYRNRLWSDGQMTNFQNWRPEIPRSFPQPDNGYYANQWGLQHCTAVSYRYSGRWTDEYCFANMPFFCYNNICSQSSCGLRQYYFVNEPMIWTEAQTYCREFYTDLATIDNMEEMNQLIDTIHGVFFGLAWIGLYDDVNSWWWSLDNTALQGFENWQVWIPQDVGGQSLYIYMQHYYRGIWVESPDSSLRPFVCFDGQENASISYVLIMESKTWSDAQSYCREFYTDLVSIRNDTENTWVIHLIQTASTDAWIGLYRTRSWSDQSNSTFSNWKPGQPDNAQNSEYCTSVSFSDNGQWTDENCNNNLAFVCYTGQASSRQYYFVNQPMIWTNAQNYCREFYTDLATIDNMEEMNLLISTVYGVFSGFNSLAWIGLYDDLTSWRWSLQDESFYKDGEKDFRGFDSTPNNKLANEFCVYLDYNGKWWDESCSTYYLFVCYDGRPNSSQKYVLVWLGKTWSDAQSYCREMFTDLASVRNETELQEILAAARGFNVWIGLYRNRVWSDHSNSTFTNWLLGSSGDQAQPDNGMYFQGQAGSQHCTTVSLQSFGQWTDEACFLTHPFFCYIGEQDAYVTGLKVEFSSLVMLSESQVQEKVVNQLQLELVRRGVRGNFTSNLRSFRRIDP